MRCFYIFIILFICAAAGEDIQSNSEHDEKNDEGHIEQMDTSFKEETHHESPSPAELIHPEDGESHVNGDTVIVDVKKEVNHDPPVDMAPQVEEPSREDSVAESESDMSTHAEDARQVADAPPTTAEPAVESETPLENAENSVDAASQAEEPVPHTSDHEALVDDSTPDSSAENTVETEQHDSGSSAAVATEPEEHVENMMNQDVETVMEPEPVEEHIDTQENVSMPPPDVQENIDEPSESVYNGGEQTKEEVEEKIEPATQVDQTVHDGETHEHVEISEVSPDADEKPVETPIEPEVEQPEPETADPEQATVISDAPESISHEASPEEVMSDKGKIEHQDAAPVQEQESPEEATREEETVEQVSDPLLNEAVKSETPVEPLPEMVTETVEQVSDSLDEEEAVKSVETPVEPLPEMVTETVEQVSDPLVEEELVKSAETPSEPEADMVTESAEEIVKPIESPDSSEESAQPTEVPVVEKETEGDKEPADGESSQEESDDNGGYQSGSLCTYCKYCKDCAKCRNCPTCKEDPSGEHCEICKYCKYCYLCDYICVTVCNPGGFLDSVSGLFYSALPTFPKGGKQDDKSVKEDL